MKVLALSMLMIAGGLVAQSATSLTEVRSLLSRGEFSEASARTSDMLRAKPGDPVLWILKGLAERGAGKTRESLHSFESALKLQPGNPTALRGAAEAAFSLHEASAATYINGILQTAPSDATAHAMAGSLAFDQGDCQTAMQEFEQAGDVLRANRAAALQASHCDVMANEPGKAVEVLEHFSGQSDTPEFTYDLASAHFYSGHYEESVALLKHLISQGGSKAEVFSLLGASLDKLDRVPEALSAYQQACETAPNTSDPYIDLARFSMEHSSAGAAIKVLNAGLARNPNSAALFTVRGSIYAYQGDPALAEADFANAERVDPASSLGGVGRSLQLKDLGQSARSEDGLREELRKHPNDTEVELFLAENLVGSHDPLKRKEAQVLLANVLRSRPNDSTALLSSAKLWMDADQYATALPLLQRAQKQDPESAAVLNRLLQVYRRLNMRQESAATAALLRSALDRDREQELKRNRFQINAEDR